MKSVTQTLIDVGTVEANLDNFHLFDIRWKLNEPDYGHQAYLEGHIPGAVFADLDRDLSAPPDRGRHPLPSPATFAETLGRLGLTPTDDVVVYDDVSGTIAARMWWMLQAIGHDRARLLDGGLGAWLEAGLPVSKGPVDTEPATYPSPQGFAGVVEMGELEGRTLLDVRARERYEGKTEPVDPLPGHIPGAINVPASDALEGGKFIEPSRLADLYGEFDQPVVSCGSGVVACHTALAIATAGGSVPDLYVGSYSEWSRSGLPVNTGTTP
jgi:thiosulfate/3-mercaptopyruvate sulfurtransferase